MSTRHVLLAAGALCATSAFAELVAVGVNTGVLTTFNAEIVAQDLFVTVDNTQLSLGGVSGSVTAFGFNTPWAAPLTLSDVSVSYQVLSAAGPTDDWNPLSEFALNAGIGGGNKVEVDLGIESDDNGNPNGNSVANGVEFGEVVRFKFSFDSGAYEMPEVDSLADFFNQNPNGPDILVRWQNVLGSTAGNSDAFSGDWSTDIPQGGEVPEPSTYGLIGIAALLGAVGVRRLRRKASEVTRS